MVSQIIDAFWINAERRVNNRLMLGRAATLLLTVRPQQPHGQ
jgi:hypothetical protein